MEEEKKDNQTPEAGGDARSEAEEAFVKNADASGGAGGAEEANAEPAVKSVAEVEANAEPAAQTVTAEGKEDAEPAAAAGAPASKGKKALNIAVDVVLYLFLAFSVLLLIMTLVSRKRGGDAVNLFGREARIVVSNSMEMSEDEEFNKSIQQYKIKDIKVRTMVFIKRAPDPETDPEKAKAFYASLKVGDVLTFRYYFGGAKPDWANDNSAQPVITHRIVDLTPLDDGHFRIVLQGDNRAAGHTPDVQTLYTDAYLGNRGDERYKEVIGKVTGKSVVLGNIAYAVRQPIGIALIIIVPCAVIIIWQIVRIALVIAEDKKKKAAEAQAKKEQAAAEELERTRKQAEKEAYEREQKERELEELKRKVAELERASGRKKDDAQD